jgi:phosphoglucosamine mutase
MAELRVGCSLSFGTDGVRGRADAFPFTDEALVALGYAIGQWAQQAYNKIPRVVVGADTRQSGERIKNALCNGLIQGGGCHIRDAGVFTTPGIFKLISGPVRHSLASPSEEFEGRSRGVGGDLLCDLGVVISASHNPYHDNGIKLFDARRCKITADDEKKIVQAFEQCFGHIAVCSCEQSVTQWPEASIHYQQNMIAYFKPLFLQNVKVVLDCANGAAHKIAPEIFRALGATVIAIADKPNGININDHCGSLHPEKLARVVKEQNADAGFAFDGDADRVVAVNRLGEIKDGDDILTLLLNLPAYKNVTQVVGTLFTNKGFEEYLVGLGKQLLRTKVGEKYVASKLDEEDLPLGGEVSGHIITRDYSATGDGIFVALKVLESVIAADNWDMVTFHKFPQVLVNVPVAHKHDLSVQPYTTLIEEYERTMGTGRIIVRYSGTEPLLRVMTEAPTYDLAQGVAKNLAEALQKALENS